MVAAGHCKKRTLAPAADPGSPCMEARCLLQGMGLCNPAGSP